MHFLREAALELDKRGLLPQVESPAANLAAWADVFHDCLRVRWPGNVRELENFARQLVLHSVTAPVLPVSQGESAQDAGHSRTVHEPRPRQRRMVEVSQAEFEQALNAHRFEVAPAARELGVSRQAVYRRMEETPGLRLAGQLAEREISVALHNNPGDIVAAAMTLRVSPSGLRARLRSMDRGRI